MKTTVLASLLLAALAGTAAHAQDFPPATSSGNSADSNNGWSGSGEFGYAAARGNSHTENINAKLGLKQENDFWKNSFFLNGLRSKGDVTVKDANGNTVDQYSTTANRYDAGASVGYKLDPRSYIVSAARYEHDNFGANLWQATVSVGYGYIALKTQRTELSFEIGPGYKRYRRADRSLFLNGASTTQQQDPEGEAIVRGLINYKYRLTANTSFENTFLTEAGSRNKYYQDDAGLSVDMTKKVALKVGFQVRYNSDTLPGIKNTDTLTTTNLVYNF